MDTHTDGLVVAYVGGGSREWAPKLVTDLARCESLSGTVRLHDVDREAAERNARFGNWVEDREEAAGNWTYEAVHDLGDALEGADFVVFSTQFDPAETFVHDLDVPREHGIYGAVAATIGPGGMFRAMRTMPVYREFAAAVREHCPDAWVFNYTNPVTFVTRALYEEYPDINAVGLCHEVFGLQSTLADLVAEYLDAERPSREDIEVNVKGINHFTWVDEARWRGRDLLDLVDRHVEREGVVREYSAEELEDASGFVDNDQVTWELYERFGILPAAGDRHLVEFAPWFIRGGKEGLNRWGVKRTPSEYRARHWEEDDTDHQTTNVEALMDEEAFELTETGEVTVDLMRALVGLEPFVTNVNLPNRGQMDDVERGAVVETNARFTADSATPLVAGTLPRPLHGLVSTHVENQETLVEAAFEGDLDRAYEAFLCDPQVLALDPDDARDLFRDLVAAEREYLTDWNLDDAAVLD
ncbi:MAG: glycoside hydrolase family 4 [Halobacteriaceae archaeon]